jgi:hypothetical protein
MFSIKALLKRLSYLLRGRSDPDAFTADHFGKGASRRMAIELGERVSRVTSYRGRVAIYLLSTQNEQGDYLKILATVDGEPNGDLPPPENARAAIGEAALSAVIEELQYTGHVGINFADYQTADAKPYSLQAWTEVDEDGVHRIRSTVGPWKDSSASSFRNN